MNIGWMLFSFSGRLRRAWYWPLALGTTAFFGLIVDFYEGTIFDSNGALVLAVVVLLLYAYAMGALAAKRLHDRNRSALLLLIMFVPIVGWIYPLWFLVDAALPGTTGDNRFGSDPRAASRANPAGVLAKVVHSDRGDATSNFALSVLIIAAVAGFFIARDWAQHRHADLATAGEYVDAALSAAGDRHYWADLEVRLEKQANAAQSPASAPEQTSGVGRNPVGDVATNAQAQTNADLAQAKTADASCDGGSCDEGTAWQLGEVRDDSTGKMLTVAKMIHKNTKAPGLIAVAATCMSKGNLLVFFFSRDAQNKTAPIDYQQLTDEDDKKLTDDSYYLGFYQIDDGPWLLNTSVLRNQPNDGAMNISLTVADPAMERSPVTEKAWQEIKELKNPAELTSATVEALKKSAAPKDIKPFVAASVVTFVIVLKGGTPEVVQIEPQAPSFRKFLSKCGLAGQAP